MTRKQVVRILVMLMNKKYHHCYTTDVKHLLGMAY